MTLRTTFAEADSAIKKSNADQQIKKVMFFGASIINQSFSTVVENHDARLELAKYGIDAEVFEHGVPGDTIADFLLRIDAVIATQAGEKGVLFFMHGGGNNVTNTRPFATATDAEKKEIVDGIRTIANKVKAAGFTFVMSNISRRYYDGINTLPENEAQPYNKNLIEPLMREIAPYCWNSISNEPHVNMHRILGDDFSMFEADGIHPNADGEIHVNRSICRGIGEMFGRSLPMFEPASGARVVVGFGRATAYTNPSINHGNADTRGNAVAITTHGLGYVTYVIDNTAYNRGGRGNAGVTTATWDNDEVQQASVFTELDPFPNGGIEQVVHKIGNIKAGATGVMTISGSRASSLSTRITEITYNGESKTFDPTSLTPVNVQFRFIADENGEIVFTQNAAAGSLNSYVSVTQLDFD